MKNWRGDSAAKPARDWRKPGASADIADTIRLERQSILNHTWKETEKPSPKSISCLKKTPLPAKRWGFCATKSLLFLISFPRLQIPGYSNTIWQICFTGTLLDHLKKVNSNSLFCKTKQHYPLSLFKNWLKTDKIPRHSRSHRQYCMIRNLIKVTVKILC